MILIVSELLGVRRKMISVVNRVYRLSFQGNGISVKTCESPRGSGSKRICPAGASLAAFCDSAGMSGKKGQFGLTIHRRVHPGLGPLVAPG
jgi:hypothetical protein